MAGHIKGRGTVHQHYRLNDVAHFREEREAEVTEQWLPGLSEGSPQEPQTTVRLRRLYSLSPQGGLEQVSGAPGRLSLPHQGELYRELEDDRSSGPHLPLHLPVPHALILEGLRDKSTSSTVSRPLAEACWAMRVRATAPPAMLEASLSVSLGRSLLAGEPWAP
ncbi:hypothetical protein EYF80_036569 [Liparis tanakae]|uniref:Uncharacterized protein n=1 Tax=Liparis tanakae TaxID=230148 RepID=A0A4Z2GI37_9TELE|nr:hypothetical protein EYF80_036569 [Liparis tanakae]